MKFEEGVKIETSEFWYDLFEGGYIKPEKLLANKEDASKVREAMNLIEEFRDRAAESGVIDEQ
jgi:hypothetical protein